MVVAYVPPTLRTLMRSPSRIQPIVTLTGALALFLAGCAHYYPHELPPYPPPESAYATSPPPEAPPAAGHQSPGTSHRSPGTGRQPLAARHEPLPTSHQPLATSHWPPAPFLTKNGRPFPVFDCLLFLHKPDLRAYGLTPLSCPGSGFYRSNPWIPGGIDYSQPGLAQAQALARRTEAAGYTWCVLDIERWPNQGDAAAVDQTIRKYIELMDWMHAAAPELKIGFYAELPICDYWNAIKGPQSAAYQAWAAANRRLAPVARHVDAIFPSLYTFYTDFAGWQKYALANIAQARMYGKPVYPFLMPQYHDSNKKLAADFLPAGYWRQQLETCYAHADGIVIWGGWMDHNNHRCVWDPGAPWWQETLAFLREHGRR